MNQLILLLIEKDCFQDKSSYTPIDFPGHGKTVEADPKACQLRCANVDGCSYFTFWQAEKSCHLSGPAATRTWDQWATSGPKRCEGDRKISCYSIIIKTLPFTHTIYSHSSTEFNLYVDTLEPQIRCSLENLCGENVGSCYDVLHHTDCKIGLQCGERNCYLSNNGVRTKTNCCHKPQCKNQNIYNNP